MPPWPRLRGVTISAAGFYGPGDAKRVDGWRRWNLGQNFCLCMSRLTPRRRRRCGAASQSKRVLMAALFD